MDLLESYDSEDEKNLSSVTDTSKSDNTVLKSLEDYRNKYSQRNKDRLNKNRNNFNTNNNHSHNFNQFSEVSLMKYDEKDAKTSLKSRVYLDYENANHLNKKNYQDSNRSSKQETVLYNRNKEESLVVGIELGTRNNSSGIVTGKSENELRVKEDKNEKSIKNKSEKMAKELNNEHRRKEEDMMYANYPVDHPEYKRNTTLENYKNNEDKSTTRSFGSIHTNPSGVAEKVYFNEVAFEDVMLKNDLKVILQNDPKAGENKRRRLKQSEVNSEEVFGPWIPYEEGELPVYTEISNPTENEEQKEKKKKFRSKNQLGSSFPKYTPEQAKGLNEVEVSDGKQVTKFNEVNVSTFHRKVEEGKQYKNWVLAPRNSKTYDPETYKSILPKQEVFTYTGHTMAVQKIEFIPNTGHMILSASMDGFVKIWDVNNTRKCVRTYKGHSKGVRDISFIEGGNKFFSCSFDSNTILWDTEYGKIVGVYPIEKTPYCLTVYPNEESIFIVGGENKKACQFDSRTGDIVLEYSEHMGCVNTVTFIDNNKKILTTGDDKRLLVWDYNIPVVVKQISNPVMHTIPALINHPNDKFVLAQSMDNQIIVYESAGSRFKLFGRKKFRGHQNAGYAIKPTCSPDGRYVASGDSRGKLFIWDWKTCKNIQTLSGHKAVTMDCKWHPSYPSTMATCSWDGTIKLWE